MRKKWDELGKVEQDLLASKYGLHRHGLENELHSDEELNKLPAEILGGAPPKEEPKEEAPAEELGEEAPAEEEPKEEKLGKECCGSKGKRHKKDCPGE